MRTWIDNTGLHSAGKLLLGAKNKSEFDVKGLIQLATLIIFSDEIIFNGFEIDPIAQRSNEIIEKLFKEGLKKEIIKPLYDEEKYFEVVKETALECATKLPFDFPNHVDPYFLRPANIPPNIIAAETSYLDIAINSKSPSELEELKNDYKKERAAKIIHYMFADCEELRSSLKKVHQKNNLTQPQLLQIYFNIRYCINQNLASGTGANYTPSIGRQQIMRYEYDFILNKLDDALKNVVRFYNPRTNLPSFALYLIIKSNGNPIKLIRESFKAREKAEPLRRKFAELISNKNSLSSESKLNIEKEIKDLSVELKVELNITKGSQLSDAIDFSIPLPFFDKSEIKKLRQYCSRHKKITLLTEVSKEIIYNEIKVETNFKKLLL